MATLASTIDAQLDGASPAFGRTSYSLLLRDDGSGEPLQSVWRRVDGLPLYERFLICALHPPIDGWRFAEGNDEDSLSLEPLHKHETLAAFGRQTTTRAGDARFSWPGRLVFGVATLRAWWRANSGTESARLEFGDEMRGRWFFRGGHVASAEEGSTVADLLARDLRVYEEHARQSEIARHARLRLEFQRRHARSGPRHVREPPTISLRYAGDPSAPTMSAVVVTDTLRVRDIKHAYILANQSQFRDVDPEPHVYVSGARGEILDDDALVSRHVQGGAANTLWLWRRHAAAPSRSDDAADLGSMRQRAHALSAPGRQGVGVPRQSDAPVRPENAGNTLLAHDQASRGDDADDRPYVLLYAPGQQRPDRILYGEQTRVSDLVDGYLRAHSNLEQRSSDIIILYGPGYILPPQTLVAQHVARERDAALSLRFR